MGYAAKVIINVILTCAAFIVAYELRRALPLEWWLTHPDAPRILWWAVMYGAIALAIEMMSRAERASWRFVSVRDALVLLRNTAFTALTFLALMFVSERAISLPRTSLLLAWILSFGFLIGLRVVWRLISNPRSILAPRPGDPSERPRIPLIIVGRLVEAEIQVRRWEAANPDEYRPVGFIVVDPKNVGLEVRGLPVIGHVGSVVDVAAQRLASVGGRGALLFLADPVKDLGLSTETVGRLRKDGHKLLRLPTVQEHGGSQRAPLREIPLEEFLPRTPAELDPAPVEALVSGRCVLVTGAGGSIGSELSRQLVALGCAKITLVDHSEFALFEIDRELRSKDRAPAVEARICNVRDRERLEEVFAASKPHLVFHAAALKHVTLVEQNPMEGFLTNVVGTHNVIEAAKSCGAHQMTLVSTDKAVDASNVMGATKRIAEMIVMGQGSNPTRFCTVRFGNVLGSAGSVIPLFRQQIDTGGPITVTDPDVERYFMTIPEAVQLVLHASAINAEGDLQEARKFVLEMGEPVKILDLAHQLIRLSGLEPDDIQIVFTGLKPGEKLTEKLIEDGDQVERRAPSILEIVRRAEDTGEDSALAVHLAATLGNLVEQEKFHHALREIGVELQ